MCYSQTLCSDDNCNTFDGNDASFSQTISGLAPAFYTFSVEVGFNNAVPCTVNYWMDDVLFHQSTPVNNGLAYELDGPWNVEARADHQVLRISMKCPNADDNGGWAQWRNPSFTGPYVDRSHGYDG